MRTPSRAAARRASVGLGLALLAAGAAPAIAAEARPLTTPQADVAITYSVLGVADTQRLAVSIALHRQRVDAPGGQVAVITDRRAARMVVLDLVRHLYADLPAPGGGVDPLQEHEAFARIGQDTVAGVACTVWRTTDPQGATIDMCLDAEGDMLSLASGGDTLIHAVSVSHAVQDPALFSPPPGFRPTSGAAPMPTATPAPTPAPGTPSAPAPRPR